MKVIKYVIKHAEFKVTDAEFNLVQAMYRKGGPMRIEAIKFIRCQYGIGLREAKEIADAIAEMDSALPAY